jgi:WD40 repeat protein
VAVGTLRSDVFVFESATGNLQSQIDADDAVISLAFDSKGSHLASAGLHTVQLFETRGGKRTLRLKVESRTPAVAFSPDGSIWLISEPVTLRE